MPSRKPSKNDQIDTKLLPDAKIGPVPRSTQFYQIPMLQCVTVLSMIVYHFCTDMHKKLVFDGSPP